MTTTKSIGASSVISYDAWKCIPWVKAKKQIFRLQMRIAKATRQGKYGRVKALQRILTHSYYAKCLAVKRVTTNKGAKTPGVDHVLWKSDRRKVQAVLQLQCKGYKPLPLKRVYIPKKSGKLRPLSIPTMKDRAMQALWHLALEPVAEQVADFNAYGFRPKRSTSDAIEQCFIALSTKVSAQWVFEGDIYACFDEISHDWLLKNIPMDKQILGKFLKAGFIEKKVMHPTKHGIPQGGIIAPTLTVIALSGLEKKLKSRFPKNRKVASKVNMVSYADDFIITGVSKAILEESVIPIVEEHLRERGLSLSQAKSRITHIKEGFDFLGFCIRKYNDKLLIKPAKANVKKFLKEIKELIKHKRALKTEDIITTLNPKIRGWCNYYRSVVSSRTFSYVDNAIFWALYSWACRRHPHRGKRWIYAKYYCTKSVRKWRFHAKVKDKEGNNKTLYLYIASTTKTIKHIKTRYNANPYHPEFIEYFKLRDERVKKRQEKRQLVQ